MRGISFKLQEEERERKVSLQAGLSTCSEHSWCRSAIHGGQGLISSLMSHPHHTRTNTFPRSLPLTPRLHPSRSTSRPRRCSVALALNRFPSPSLPSRPPTLTLAEPVADTSLVLAAKWASVWFETATSEQLRRLS